MNFLKKFFRIASILMIAAIIFSGCSNDDDQNSNEENKKPSDGGTEQTPGGDDKTPSDGESDASFSGVWWYYDVDTSKVADAESITVMFNNGNLKTKNVTGVPLTGTVHYEWSIKWANESEAPASTKSDKPSDGPTEGNVRVYVYTDAETVNLYAYKYTDGDAASTELCGTYPGSAMKSDEVTLTETEYSVTVTITGLDEGEYICFCGNAYGWNTPCPSWVKNDVDAAKEKAKISLLAVANESGEATYKNFPYKTASSEFPVVIVVLSDVATGANIVEPESLVSESGPTVAVQTEASTITLDRSNTSVNAAFEIDKSKKTLIKSN